MWKVKGEAYCRECNAVTPTVVTDHVLVFFNCYDCGHRVDPDDQVDEEDID